LSSIILKKGEFLLPPSPPTFKNSKFGSLSPIVLEGFSEKGNYAPLDLLVPCWYMSIINNFRDTFIRI